MFQVLDSETPLCLWERQIRQVQLLGGWGTDGHKGCKKLTAATITRGTETGANEVKRKRETCPSQLSALKAESVSQRAADKGREKQDLSEWEGGIQKERLQHSLLPLTSSANGALPQVDFLGSPVVGHCAVPLKQMWQLRLRIPRGPPKRDSLLHHTPLVPKGLGHVHNQLRPRGLAGPRASS